MIKGRDIIVVGVQPWDIEIGSNCKNIAHEFSKHNRVLYVNPPSNRITILKEKNKPKVQKRIQISKGLLPAMEMIQENLWNLYPKTINESINWISFEWLYDILNKRNTKFFANNIMEAVEELGFENYLLFNDSSMFLGMYLKELLTPELYVYYVRDNLVKETYWKRHGVRSEPEVIKKADLVVNNSEYYVEYSKQFNSNSFMVGQGCDTSIFIDADDSIPLADDLKDMEKPIIGYVGALTSLRLDIGLIEYIAKEKPNWNIVLVGPEDQSFKKSCLHDLSNVYFFGIKPMDSLPTYIKGFDVAINPQFVNEITIGNYPRKIDEYLAMGKPIVATNTKAMQMFADWVYLGDTKEDYVRLIEKAIKERLMNRLGKIEFAKSHSWENSVKNIYHKMELTLKSLE